MESTPTTSATTFPADDFVALEQADMHKVETFFQEVSRRPRGVKSLRDELKYFEVPDLDGYIFLDINHAYDSFNNDLPESFEGQFYAKCSSMAYGRTLNVKPPFKFEYVVLVKTTVLVKHPVQVVITQADDTPQHDVDTPKQATMDSFLRSFKDKVLLSESFLSYLARHYGTEEIVTKNDPSGLKYYAPFMAANQSSGSGKSRLLHEISEWVLPVILSGPNLTGVPSGSTLLKDFTKLIVQVGQCTTSCLPRTIS